jgi:putative transposase
MAKQKRKYEPLPTIWEVDDVLWNIIIAIINQLDPAAATGRKRVDLRAALNGIVYIMRSGCQWNKLPKEFGDDSSVHRTMQRWIEKGILKRIWATLIENCDELGGVDWKWQSADAAMGKARFGGISSAQTPQIARNPVPNAA